MGFAIELDGAAHELEIVSLRPLKLRVDGFECVVTSPDDGGEGRRTIEIDGETFHFSRAGGSRQILRFAGHTFEAELVDPLDGRGASAGGQDYVRAPMPGTVVHIHKQPGERISRGEALLTIESMKLQMTLNAPRDGLLAKLTRGVGETFDKDETVAELAPVDQP